MKGKNTDKFNNFSLEIFCVHMRIQTDSSIFQIS